MSSAQSDIGQVLKGEFHTDGNSFVFRFVDSPVSGVGATAAEAYESLIQAEAKAGDLALRLRVLAKDQAQQAIRTSLWRAVLAALVGLTIIGGALGGAAAFAPRVAADLAEVTIGKLREWRGGLSEADQALIESVGNEATEVEVPPATDQ